MSVLPVESKVVFEIHIKDFWETISVPNAPEFENEWSEETWHEVDGRHSWRVIMMSRKGRERRRILECYVDAPEAIKQLCQGIGVELQHYMDSILTQEERRAFDEVPERVQALRERFGEQK